MRTQLWTILSEHQSFLRLLLLFVAFRLMAAWLLRPGGYLGVMSDYTTYRLLARWAGQGFYPGVHYWVEYPPLFPWIAVAIYRLSVLLPSVGEAGFWFNSLLSTLFVASEAINLCLVYSLAHHLHGPRKALRIAWTYALLFVTLLVALGRLDLFGLTFLLGATWLVVKRRPTGVAVVAAIGFLVKLLPLLALPSAFWREETWPRRFRLVALALAVVVLLALPLALLDTDFFFASWRSQLQRGSWSTVWALLDGYFGFGIPGGANRFDPAKAGAGQHPASVPYGLVATLLAAFWLWLWTRRINWHDETKGVAFTATTVFLFTLVLKGYSPQFLAWLLPFVLLLLPGLRGAIYALLLSVINLIEDPGYFTLLPGEHWLLTGVVLARTVLIAWLAYESARLALGRPLSARLSRRACAVCAGAVLLLALIAMPFAYRSLFQSSLSTSTHKPMLERIETQAHPGARVVIGDPQAFDDTFAFLQSRFEPICVEPHDWYPAWETRLERAVAGQTQVWIYAPVNSPLHGWAEAHLQPLAAFDLEAWRLTGWEGR